MAAGASIKQAPPPAQAAWDPNPIVLGPAPPEQAAWDPNPIVLGPALPAEGPWDPNPIVLGPAVQAPHPANARAAGLSPARQTPRAAASQARPGAVILSNHGVASQQQQDSASKGSADQDSSGKGSRVAVEVSNGKKRPLRDEALQAGQASRSSPAKAPQQMPATPSKRAKTIPGETPRGIAQVSSSRQVSTLIRL